MSTRNPVVREVGRALAELALMRVEQGGRLNVRQREELRRALARAGDALEWEVEAVHADDPVAALSKDVVKIAQSGAQSLTRELAGELETKNAEVRQLEKAAAAARKIAEDSRAKYPTEITYRRTAREAASGLVTKTETLTLNDATEAEEVAANIESSLDRWGSLRDQMVVELKDRQTRLTEMKSSITDFVRSLRGLLSDVIVTLH